MASSAHALLTPQPLGTDDRIKTVRYSINEIYKFTGHYGYQSVIEFGPDEEIMTVSIGDSTAWQVKPNGSRMFIKPVEQDALTNMTIITTAHTYYFELHADETGSIKNNDLVFVLRFLYDDAQPMVITQGQDAPPDLTDPELRNTLNFNYAIVGPEAISPMRIYDDGEFTYFEYEDVNATLPAFYAVDALGNESVVNFRVLNNTIAVEEVGAVFTLRNGIYVLCVFNENAKLDSVPQGEEIPWWQKVFF